MHILLCAEGSEEFSKVSSCDNAKEIWDKLEVVHEGLLEAEICTPSKLYVHGLGIQLFQSSRTCLDMFLSWIQLFQSSRTYRIPFCVFFAYRGRCLGRYSIFCLSGFWVFGSELHQYSFPSLESAASCGFLHQPSYNVELLFAASFDSKMGSLCSVFDVKKQGKLIREVRTRYWKLREGENRLSGLLEGISGEGMRNDAMGSWHSCAFCSPDFCIFGLEYRYSSVVSVPNFNTGIWVSVLLEEYRYPFEFRKVSILGEGYRYPFEDSPYIDTRECVSVPKFLNGT
ncbi:hypothetical protein GQ457_05G020140 [Hibiscus cannabinus]